MKWCERQGVGYVLGLVCNRYLVRALRAELREVRSVPLQQKAFKLLGVPLERFQ